MDSSSLVRAVALLARLQPLLLTFHEEKTWYLSVIEKNEKSEKNDFLCKKTQMHICELERISCMLDELLYPECRKEELAEEDVQLLSFINSNALIKQKILEKMSISKT
jgi:hypothetical protein